MVSSWSKFSWNFVCVCRIDSDYGIVKTNCCEGLCILMSLGGNTVKGIGLFLRIAWGRNESLVWDRGETRRLELRERGGRWP